MYAVIESGSKQYRVEPGSVVEVDRLTTAPGEEVVFDRVLIVGDGEDVQIGAPVVSDARVAGEVLDHPRGRKVVVFKYKPRKRYRIKTSQRRCLTRVRITEISL